MRGKGRTDTVGYEESRITPAYAGKRVSSISSQTSRWDHPRLCGEKECIGEKRVITGGSPPPMRGKAKFVVDTRETSGITPAYAGKRNLGNPCRKQQKDHPRLCGEKPPCPASALAVHGITPAYAGKRQISSCPPETVQDHPRLCGEK